MKREAAGVGHGVSDGVHDGSIIASEPNGQRAAAKDGNSGETPRSRFQRPDPRLPQPAARSLLNPRQVVEIDVATRQDHADALAREVLRMAEDHGHRHCGRRFDEKLGALPYVAHGRDEDEICRLIGADWLVYQDLDDLVKSSREGNPDITQFECSVFDGSYVTGDVDQGYLDRVEALRNDDAKQKRLRAAAEEGAVVGLHNEVS